MHEVIHAVLGDTTKANYGIPWGAPYGAPEDLPAGQEAQWLERFNRDEAMAFVGVTAVSRALFGIDWSVYTARDVGTYGFVGGNAVVPTIKGFRAIPHYDREHHRARYYDLARKLEAEAATALDEKLGDIKARFESAEVAGRARSNAKRPRPEELARIAPRMPGRTDLCLCGSAKKYKKCCGAA